MTIKMREQDINIGNTVCNEHGVYLVIGIYPVNDEVNVLFRNISTGDVIEQKYDDTVEEKL